MRRTRGIGLALAGAVLAAGAGYGVGVWTGESAERPSGALTASCEEARRVAASLMAGWWELEADDARRMLRARAAALVVLDNAECYPLEARAHAQAAERQFGQSGLPVPVQAAAGISVCRAVGREECTS
ncbi:hypothetical protein [Kitasatospora sp. NPDC093806]|uniref:hypothetical protein n=1 Tax=Kitasatospora sp. NPDC093806 TaxID=3155075 RepID=UPI00342C8BA0